MITRPAWMLRAACHGCGADDFFDAPTVHDSGRACTVSIKIATPHNLAEQRALNRCQKCPVRRPCLTHALTYPEQWGIWGGHTADERDTITDLLHDGLTLDQAERRIHQQRADQLERYPIQTTLFQMSA